MKAVRVLSIADRIGFLKVLRGIASLELRQAVQVRDQREPFMLLGGLSDEQAVAMSTALNAAGTRVEIVDDSSGLPGPGLILPTKLLAEDPARRQLEADARARGARYGLVGGIVTAAVVAVSHEFTLLSGVVILAATLGIEWLVISPIESRGKQV